MSPTCFAFLFCLLHLIARTTLAESCKEGKAKLVLTEVSGGDHCLSNEVAVLWPYMNVTISADCNYELEGVARGSYQYPTTFAPVSYTTRNGGSRSFAAFHSSTSSSGFNTFFDWSSGTNSSRSKASASDFDSFTYSWAASGLLQIKDFTYYDVVSSAFAFRKTGPSSFKMILKPDSCTYSYRIVSGVFAGLAVSGCAPGSNSECPNTCPSGKYKQGLQHQGKNLGFVCGLCPAGTAWSTANSGSCTACPAGSVASAAGSTKCSSCPPGQVSRANGTSCGACDTLGSYPPQNSIFLGDQACQNFVCPDWSIATIQNDCLGAYSGQLCVVKSATGDETAKCPPGALKGEAAIGGAILELDSPASDISNPVCTRGPSMVAAWLKGKSSWMGFDFNPQGTYNNQPRVDWQVLGPVNASFLGAFHYCGVSPHGGAPSYEGLTAATSVLDTTALNFRSFVNNSGWQVLASKGTGGSSIKTVWFPDGQSADCSSFTSLGVRDRAQGKLAEGTCTLTFKVAAGSILGASGGKSCPKSTVAVQQPDGSTSCLACALGSVAQSGKCVKCLGKSYQDAFGAESCKACQGTTTTVNSEGGFTYCYPSK